MCAARGFFNNKTRQHEHATQCGQDIWFVIDTQDLES